MDDPPATPGTGVAEQPGHRPVLLHPLINGLQPQAGQVVVDATLGGGGVTAALLEHVIPGGRVIAFDRDETAIALARRRFAHLANGVSFVHADFASMATAVADLGYDTVDSVAFDLGISSLQLDDPERGFSFRFDAPLDMRMSRGDDMTAADIVNGWDEGDLESLIRDYGEERFARRIAAAIVRTRATAPVRTTADLRELCANAIPRRFWPKRIHPATRTFQALRIEVNHELRSLQQGLQAAISIIRPGGRLGVIAFHSLEDTIAKNALHVAAQNCLCPPQQPICTCAHRASLTLPGRKAIKPSSVELLENPRARSARLRIAIKL